jgi:hypothetical protein
MLWLRKAIGHSKGSYLDTLWRLGKPLPNREHCHKKVERWKDLQQPEVATKSRHTYTITHQPPSIPNCGQTK